MKINNRSFSYLLSFVVVFVVLIIVTAQESPDTTTSDFWENTRDQVVETVNAANDSQQNNNDENSNIPSQSSVESIAPIPTENIPVEESNPSNSEPQQNQSSDSSSTSENNPTVFAAQDNVVTDITDEADIIMSSSCEIDARYITAPGVIPVIVEWKAITDNVLGIQWTFSNGTTSTNNTVQRTYENTGTYNVTLTCDTPIGLLTDTGSITISNNQTGGSFLITSTPLPTLTATPSRTPTFTRTPTRTPTLGPSPTPSNTKLPTATKTATSTPTLGPSPTKTPTKTKTPTPTLTLVVSCDIDVVPDPNNVGEYTFAIKGDVNVNTVSWQIDGKLYNGRTVTTSFVEEGTVKAEVSCTGGGYTVLRTVFVQVTSSIGIDLSGGSNAQLQLSRTPTMTLTPLPTVTSTPSPTATNTALPTATYTLSPTMTDTALPTATNTLSPEPTATLKSVEPISKASEESPQSALTDDGNAIGKDVPAITGTDTTSEPQSAVDGNTSVENTKTPTSIPVNLADSTQIPAVNPTDSNDSTQIPTSSNTSQSDANEQSEQLNTSEETQIDLPVATLIPAENGLALPADWEPIIPYPKSCDDWIGYHSNKMAAINIFRLGNLPDGQTADPNLSREPNTLNLGISVSADRQWVAFASDRDLNFEIYISSVVTDDIRRLTHSQSVEFNPVWSPHGYDILFESNQTGNADLFLTNITTGITRQLTDHTGADINPSWSPMNPNIAVFQSNRSGKWQIYQLDMKTNAVTLLSDSTANDTVPIFAHDSNEIVFLSDRDTSSALYLLAEDGTIKQVSEPAADVRNHVWSPDDTLLAYQSDNTGIPQIYVYEFASHLTRRVTGDENTVDIVPSFAPTFRCSGSHSVIYTTTLGSQSDIFESPTRPMAAPAIDVASTAHNLTNDPLANDGFPQGLTATKSNFARFINSFIDWQD